MERNQFVRSFISDPESLFKERVNNFPTKQNQKLWEDGWCDKRDRHDTRLIEFAFFPDELKCTDARDLKFTQRVVRRLFIKSESSFERENLVENFPSIRIFEWWAKRECRKPAKFTSPCNLGFIQKIWSAESRRSEEFLIHLPLIL